MQNLKHAFKEKRPKVNTMLRKVTIENKKVRRLGIGAMKTTSRKTKNTEITIVGLLPHAEKTTHPKHLSKTRSSFPYSNAL